MTRTENAVGKSRFVDFPLGMGIFLLPAIFSWFVLREGYSATARILSFGWLILLLIVVFGADHSRGPIKGSEIHSLTASGAAPTVTAAAKAKAKPNH